MQKQQRRVISLDYLTRQIWRFRLTFSRVYHQLIADLPRIGHFPRERPKLVISAVLLRCQTSTLSDLTRLQVFSSLVQEGAIGVSDPVNHLLVLDLGVQLSQTLLVGSKVIKLAVVRLHVAVFRTEDKRTLAGNLHNANFLAAVPALVFVRLQTYKSIRLATFWLGVYARLSS